jgi:predicted nuclease with TOPRIM domain
MSDLRKTLENLRRQLEQTQTHDEASQQLLAQLKLDVDAALNRLEAEGETQETHTLTERLNDGVTSFEATHPDLTTALSAVIDSLSNMGL